MEWICWEGRETGVDATWTLSILSTLWFTISFQKFLVQTRLQPFSKTFHGLCNLFTGLPWNCVMYFYSVYVYMQTTCVFANEDIVVKALYMFILTSAVSNISFCIALEMLSFFYWHPCDLCLLCRTTKTTPSWRCHQPLMQLTTFLMSSLLSVTHLSAALICDVLHLKLSSIMLQSLNAFISSWANSSMSIDLGGAWVGQGEMSPASHFTHHVISPFGDSWKIWIHNPALCGLLHPAGARYSWSENTDRSILSRRLGSA